MRDSLFTIQESEALDLINEIYNNLYQLNKEDYTKEDINLYCAGLYFLFLLNDFNIQRTFLNEIVKNAQEDHLDTLKKVFNLSFPITDNENLKNIFNSNQLINHIKNFDLKSNKKIKELIIRGFELNWSEFSPLLFNSLFENNLEYDLKKVDGIHYTSEENIKRVLNPLFLEELESELKALEDKKSYEQDYLNFIEKLSELTFLDPASGAGNFLIVTFLNLVRLERKARRKLHKQCDFGVNINNFYGIEYNPIAALIAQMCLQIAELYRSQLLDLDIKTVTNKQITNDNALTYSWNNLIGKDQLSYIIGNPPFLGARKMSKDQKTDLGQVFGEKYPNIGNLDYSSGWFKKTADFIKNTTIQAGFVSTTSLFQGSSVSILWKTLLKDISITFSYKPFLWEGTSQNNAFVYVTVVGLSDKRLEKKKYIFSENERKRVDHINGYLIDQDNIYIDSRITPLTNVPQIGIGNKPIDNSNYLFTEKELKEFLNLEPEAKKYFKVFYGALDFFKRKPRYCLDLSEITEEELEILPEVKKRVDAVYNYRINSSSEPTKKMALEPTKFHVMNKPETNYLIIPRHISENRVYLPVGYLNKDNLAGDSLLILPDEDLYYFGILSSKIHYEWLKAVGGKLGNGLRYSKNIVYNNFPWPKTTEEEKDKIREKAQEILDVRAKYDINLNKIYHPDIFPEELKKVHEENDKLVESLYGFKDSKNVKELFELYKKQVELSPIN